MNRRDIWNAITVVYPVCKQGLEIECEWGYNLSVGRKRGQNLWGISSKDFSKKWRENNVSSFCRVIKPTDIHYNEDTFDIVINNNDLFIKTCEEAEQMLRHIKRICSERAYLNLPINNEITKSWWLNKIIEIGFLIECFHITTKNTLVVELGC